MSEIPIFDSLTHPTVTGGWLGRPDYSNNTVDTLLEQMSAYNISRAFAVGMGPGVDGYDESGYAGFIRSHSERLLPIAFADFGRIGSPEAVVPYLEYLKALGYHGIKIHPRFARVTYRHPSMVELIRAANRLDLLVLLCTYFWEASRRVVENNVDHLLELLVAVPEERLILTHGGGVMLMEVAEIARHFPKVLVDLSLTLCKYEGSSLDMDIRFLFSRFDRRICVGSDNPEIGLADLRRRFESLGEFLPTEKLENIAYKNLSSFVGLPP